MELSWVRLNRYGEALYRVSKKLWFLLTWPLYIYYGDYNSWLLPVKNDRLWHKWSIVNFTLIVVVNIIAAYWSPINYLLFYFIPMLLGGNRILVITSMHHTHDEGVFFCEEEHHPYNAIMSSTDRNFGFLTNFFMMNNGYHIPHHIHPKISYYDLPRASKILREKIPSDLPYKYFHDIGFYKTFLKRKYEKRLTYNPKVYQLRILNSR